MIIRINDMLKARREGLKKDEGFSLIELLVVVIIIGILAAIAIPIYIGVQNNAKDSATKSDLTNAKIAVAAYYADKGASAATPTLDAAGLGNYGFTKSADTTSLAFKGTPTSAAFCIDGVSGSAAKFSVTQSTGTASGACP